MSNSSSSIETFRQPPGRRAVASVAARCIRRASPASRAVVPPGWARSIRQRFSFCCAADGCRKRTTPPSLRFLGRKVYLATVVTLVSAMQHGATAARLERLSAALGVDRRTVARWRAWWRSTFAAGPFHPVALAAFMPPLDIARLPASLLDRFAGGIVEKLTSLLRFLGPLTGGASAMRAF